MPMKTIEGYSKEKYTDTSVLLAGGGAKALSGFIGSLTWDSTNKKIKYTPVGGTAADLVTFGTAAFENSTAFKTRITSEKSLKEPGWYRILDCTTYSMTFLITFYGGYNHQPPTPVTFSVNHSYNTTSISQIGNIPYIGWITKIRAVHYDTSKFYIDVYFNNTSYASNNNASNAVNFEITPLDPKSRGNITLVDYTLITDTVTANAECTTALKISAGKADTLGADDVGSASRPIYLDDGAPTQTTYRMAGTNVAATTALAISNNLDTGIWYVNGTNSTDLYSVADGVAYVNKYSDSWIAEIYQDYRTGQIALRGKNNGTWQAWRKVLDSSNFNTWAPKLDGTGATGTWGINVTGSAGSAAVASKISDLTTTDAASSTDTWRRVWFSYNDNVTGRPAYSDNFAYQTSNDLLKVGGLLSSKSIGSEHFLTKVNGGISVGTTSSRTGAITITLPAAVGNTMVSMWVDVYNYVTNTSFTVHVGGYAYSNSTWVNNSFATVYGADYKVRLGHNGTSFVIYIGETNSTWAYPQVVVRDVLLGYQPTVANWRKEITISWSTSFSNITWGEASGKTSHKAWTSKNLDPTTFAASSHNHSAADITSGTLAIARGGTGATTQADINKNFIAALSEGSSDFTDNTEIISSYASNNGFADTNAPNVPYKRDAIKMYNYIKGKLDSVYSATDHTHSNYVQFAIRAHDSSSAAYTGPTYISTYVGGKALIDRGSWAYANNGYVDTGDGVIPLAGTMVITINGGTSNKYGSAIFVTPSTASTPSGTTALKNEMWFFTQNGNTSSYPDAWTRVLTNRNYTSYTVKKDGTGATGSWGISVTGSAGSVAWGNVTGKPDSFTPASHSHTFAATTNKITNTNEFNFVDAEQTIIWFNYRRASGSSATTATTQFRFSQGTASEAYAKVLADGFIKNGSDSSHVLLGDGGHKAVSDFATSGNYWPLATESYPYLRPGTSNNWIKVGSANDSYGLLPSQAGNAGSGHNYLGTSSWYWKYAYIDNVTVASNLTASGTVVFSGLNQGTSAPTDETEFLTSYASTGGFANTTGAGKVYRRTMSLLWDYISDKIGDNYYKLGRNSNNLNITTTTWNGILPINAFGFRHGKAVWMYSDLDDVTSAAWYNGGSGNGTVTVMTDAEALANNSSYTPSGNSSGKVLKIEPTGSIVSNKIGGTSFRIVTAKDNAVWLQVIRAWLPVGASITAAMNGTGTGRSYYWITSKEGTGKWEWYACLHINGHGGTMSTFGHTYATLSGAAIGVKWYIASFQIYELTNNNYDSLRSRYADSASAVPWSGISDIPSTFTPASHNHAAGDITSGTLGVARGGTGKASWTQYGLIYASATTTLAQVSQTWEASKTYWLKAVTNASKVPTYSFVDSLTSDKVTITYDSTGTDYEYVTFTDGQYGEQFLKAHYNLEYIPAIGSLQPYRLNGYATAGYGVYLCRYYKSGGSSIGYVNTGPTGAGIVNGASASGNFSGTDTKVEEGKHTITLTNGTKSFWYVWPVLQVHYNITGSQDNCMEFGWANFYDSSSTGVKNVSPGGTVSFTFCCGRIHCQGSWAAKDYVRLTDTPGITITFFGSQAY